MKVFLALSTLALLSTACGGVETDRGGSYRVKDSNVEYCIKADLEVCATEEETPVVQKAPECPKRDDSEVTVFNIVGSEEETETNCEVSK